ncbi:recombinase family protein [Methylobacterium sp. D54C]
MSETVGDEAMALGGRASVAADGAWAPFGVALYAYGTGASVARQIDGMLGYCAERAMPVAGTFSDTGVGVAAPVRFGLSSLLAVVESGNVGCVVVEDLDRLSRSAADLRSIVTRIHAAGVELHDLRCGRVEPENTLLFGLSARVQRRQNAELARYACHAIVARGGWPLAAGYGYRKVAGESRSLEIHAEEAEIVRGMYRLAAHEDRTHAHIATHLAERGVHPPRGAGSWTGSSVSRLLQRDLHRGILVYGRYAAGMSLDGRRTTTLQPPERWTITEAPQLRLVDDATWHGAQGRPRRRRAA